MSFKLSVSGFDIEICLVKACDLNLHEETIPSSSRKLSESILDDGKLRHPIIVDNKTLTVLDGMHRATSLKDLNCKFAPVCLVDYQDSRITVGSWSRLWRDLNMGVLLKKCVSYGFSIESCDDTDIEELLEGKIIKAALVSKKHSRLLDRNSKSVKMIYDSIEEIEKDLESEGVNVEYGVGKSIFLKAQESGVAILLPPASKNEIVKVALSDSVLPHKTTRHVIPARPMGVDVPLDLLSGGKSLEEANSILEKSLENREIKNIPPGSIYEGREYEEELRVFK